MTAESMPEPDGPDDERFVYVVTAAGVEALRPSAAAFDSEQETQSATEQIARRRPDEAPAAAKGA